MKICFLSIDVEKRENQKNEPFEGVEKLSNILDVFKKHKVGATLFVTGEVLEKYPDLVKKWSQDFEIACHGYYHNTLDKLDFEAREQQIEDFCQLYQNILKVPLRGFRAPRNIIDNEQFAILEKYGFLYDASVFPRYPWPVQLYEGYKGRAPINPYWPSEKNYRKKCPSTALGTSNKLLEIPESPITLWGLPLLNVPLVGTWLRKLGVEIFKKLFWFKKPDFVSFSMHSWDGVKFEGKSSQNSGEIYLKQLDKMLGYLKKIGYEFKSGEEIYKENVKLQSSNVKSSSND